MPDAPPTGLIQAAVRRADDDLKSVDPAPFSGPGFAMLKSNIATYIDDLVSEADRIARRARSDTISAAHVEEAAEHLVNSSVRRLFRHLGTIGGLLLGTALSQLVTMMSDNKFTTTGVTISAVFGIVGAFLVALHVAKE